MLWKFLKCLITLVSMRVLLSWRKGTRRPRPTTTRIWRVPKRNWECLLASSVSSIIVIPRRRIHGYNWRWKIVRYRGLDRWSKRWIHRRCGGRIRIVLLRYCELTNGVHHWVWYQCRIMRRCGRGKWSSLRRRRPEHLWGVHSVCWWLNRATGLQMIRSWRDPDRVPPITWARKRIWSRRCGVRWIIHHRARMCNVDSTGRNWRRLHDCMRAKLRDIATRHWTFGRQSPVCCRRGNISWIQFRFQTLAHFTTIMHTVNHTVGHLCSRLHCSLDANIIGHEADEGITSLTLRLTINYWLLDRYIFNGTVRPEENTQRLIVDHQIGYGWVESQINGNRFSVIHFRSFIARLWSLCHI